MDSQKITLGLVLALFAFSGGAFAADEHEHGDEAKESMSCGMMDMHGMSAEARKAKMDEMFAKIDTDKDGNISRAEFDRHHEKKMESMRKQPEANGRVEQHK